MALKQSMSGRCVTWWRTIKTKQWMLAGTPVLRSSWSHGGLLTLCPSFLIGRGLFWGLSARPGAVFGCWLWLFWLFSHLALQVLMVDEEVWVLQMDFWRTSRAVSQWSRPTDYEVSGDLHATAVSPEKHIPLKALGPYALWAFSSGTQSFGLNTPCAHMYWCLERLLWPKGGMVHRRHGDDKG